MVILDRNFIKVHNDFIRSRLLRPSEKIVFMCIKSYAYSGECFPSLKTLANDSGLCVRTVQRCIKTLAEKGFLTVERRKTESGGNTTNLYRLEKERDESDGGDSMSFQGTDEVLRLIGVVDTEKYKDIYRRVGELGRKVNKERLVT